MAKNEMTTGYNLRNKFLPCSKGNIILGQSIEKKFTRKNHFQLREKQDFVIGFVNVDRR